MYFIFVHKYSTLFVRIYCSVILCLPYVMCLFPSRNEKDKHHITYVRHTNPEQ